MKEEFYKVVNGKKRKMYKVHCEYCNKEFSYRADTKRATMRCRSCVRLKYIKPNTIINGVKILKDLGIEKKIGYTTHTVLIECDKCNKIFERNLNVITAYGTTTCKSCSSKTHGLSNIDLYGVWQGIKQRCYNKKDKKYRIYGAKGVIICDEWKDNPKAFIDWSLKNGYSKGKTIDKDILCEKNNISPKIYSPDTCLWVNYSVQNANIKRKNKTNNTGITKTPSGKFEVRISFNNKMLYRQLFNTLEEAIKERKTFILNNKLPHYV